MFVFFFVISLLNAASVPNLSMHRTNIGSSCIGKSAIYVDLFSILMPLFRFDQTHLARRWSGMEFSSRNFRPTRISSTTRSHVFGEIIRSEVNVCPLCSMRIPGNSWINLRVSIASFCSWCWGWMHVVQMFVKYSTHGNLRALLRFSSFIRDSLLLSCALCRGVLGNDISVYSWVHSTSSLWNLLLTQSVSSMHHYLWQNLDGQSKNARILSGTSVEMNILCNARILIASSLVSNIVELLYFQFSKNPRVCLFSVCTESQRVR